MKTIIPFFMLLTFIQCEPAQNSKRITEATNDSEKITLNKDSVPIKVKINQEIIPIEDRTLIIKQLQNKIKNKEALIVHLFVPLCDNENQGIIPTSESLGNGMDLKRNLYWAVSKGIKRFYKEQKDWELLKSEKDIDTNILERVIFKKRFQNNALVYVIADAYRGDRMKICLEDYFNSLSNNRFDTIEIENKKYDVASGLDLAIFNGHNGLMDTEISIKENKSNRPKDAVSISCVSNQYFNYYYERTNSFPLVTTKELLYPGAFISEGIINEWAELKETKQCKVAAGKSYYKNKPKAGPNGSQNLFDFGW